MNDNDVRYLAACLRMNTTLIKLDLSGMLESWCRHLPSTLSSFQFMLKYNLVD
jgi:hypothetical protein